MKIKVPARGDIILCNFSPTSGHEQSRLRPALVLSDSELNALTGLVTVCAITSTVRGNYFEIKIQTQKTKGMIMAYQIKTIDFTARKIKIVDKADKAVLNEVAEKISVLIEG